MGANPKSNAVPFSTTRSNPLNQKEKFVFSRAYRNQRIAVIEKSGQVRYGKVARFSSTNRVHIRWDIQYNTAPATPSYSRKYAEDQFFVNFERYVWERMDRGEKPSIQLQAVHEELRQPSQATVQNFGSRWFYPAEIREASLRVWDELGKCLHPDEVLDMQANELRTALEQGGRVEVIRKPSASNRCPTCGREF